MFARPVFRRVLSDASTRRRPRGFARSLSLWFSSSAALLGVLASLGCASGDGLFKGGLFSSSKKSQVERLSSSDERGVVNRAALASTERKNPWEPTESELAQARASGVDLKDYVWATQRPNGGVLFPKKLPAPGPVVVLEPSSIAAPIGTEIVLVASFVGEDSTYLRVGEKIEWNLTGVGTFLAANPDGSTCCLDLTGKTEKRADDRYLTTETTNRLWRIHRGTETPVDDVTILRGQTWTSVQSQTEGTSSVVVFSDSIDNWDRRKASAEIYWIDAAFRFPPSQVFPIGSQAILTTLVRRRSNLDPRPGWFVRYEVLSGSAGLGPNGTNVLDVPTDANGAAVVSLAQKDGIADVCRVSATVFRPATAEEKAIPVEKSTFAISWTQAALLSVELKTPPKIETGAEFQIDALVSNNSDFEHAVQLRLKAPNADFIRSDPSPEKVENGLVVWNLPSVPPRSTTTIPIYLVKKTNDPLETLAEISANSINSQPSSTPSQGTSVAAPADALGTIPPVESPTPGSTPANGTTPPPVSPTPNSAPADAASQPPTLGAAFPSSAEIPNVAAPTTETLAFVFPDAGSNAEIAESSPRLRPVSARSDEIEPNAELDAATPRAGTPFSTRFALTRPRPADDSQADAERIVVKLAARPGLEILLPDGTRRADVAYPAAPLSELADVVYKVRLIADAPGPKALAFYAFRENGELLTTDVFPTTVAPAQDAETSRSTRLSSESVALFPQKTPIFERLPDGSVGAAVERARVGVPFVYRTVVRNFEEFALEADELDVALRLPEELAFAPNQTSTTTRGAVDPNRRRAVFRLVKRLEPRSEFELNVDLVAEKEGDVDLAFDLLDASTGARLGGAALPIAVVAPDSDAEAAR